MRKEFIKITFEDLEIAETFFGNSKHFDEFICAVISYYRGQTPSIKTKIVSKYFETYKKTMNYILDAKQFGIKGFEKKIDIQQVTKPTLEGGVEASLEPSLEVNSKVISNNNKLIINKDKDVALPLSDYQLCIEFWLKELHPDFSFGGQQGKALKSILKKIEKLRKNPEVSIVESFKMLCQRLPDWYKTKDLPVIDSKFNEIIAEIKTQNNGKQTYNDAIRSF
jgi:hypothetical protein